MENKTITGKLIFPKETLTFKAERKEASGFYAYGNKTEVCVVYYDSTGKEVGDACLDTRYDPSVSNFEKWVTDFFDATLRKHEIEIDG